MQEGKHFLSWYINKTVKVNMMSYRTEKGIPDQVKTQQLRGITFGEIK